MTDRRETTNMGKYVAPVVIILVASLVSTLATSYVGQTIINNTMEQFIATTKKSMDGFASVDSKIIEALNTLEIQSVRFEEKQIMGLAEIEKLKIMTADRFTAKDATTQLVPLQYRIDRLEEDVKRLKVHANHN